MQMSATTPIFAPPVLNLPLPARLQATRVALATYAFGAPPVLAHQPPPGLRHVPVRGDGRCLFRAIAKNLASAEKRSLPEHMERADADFLRQMAWKSICQRRRDEFAARNIIEGSMTRYCAISRNPTYFAGEPELFALADELKKPIKVFLRDDRGILRNIVTYGEKYKGRGTPKRGDGSICILYVNGNHYDALIQR